MAYKIYGYKRSKSLRDYFRKIPLLNRLERWQNIKTVLLLYCIGAGPLDIKENQNVSKIDINGYKAEISLPIDINVLNSQILKKIIDINFPLGIYKYFPYKRVISYQKKKSLLSDIQNLIIEWNFLIKFSSISVFGIVIGQIISKKIKGNHLKKIFG